MTAADYLTDEERASVKKKRNQRMAALGERVARECVGQHVRGVSIDDAGMVLTFENGKTLKVRHHHDVDVWSCGCDSIVVCNDEDCSLTGKDLEEA